MADKYLCPHCSKHITTTVAFKFRKHNGNDGEECMGSAEFVPSHQIAVGPIPAGTDPGVPAEGRDMGTCHECGRTVRLSIEGRLAGHDRATEYGFACPASDTAYQPPEQPCQTPPVTSPPTIVDVHLPPFPGTTTPSSSNPTGPPPTANEPAPTTNDAAKMLATFDPPSQEDFFAQTGRRPAAAPALPPTGDFGSEMVARLKETFYAYNNRKTSDNRSAQATLGPSEIGTPCDRRLALSLLGVPAVNPGGDGWAAWMGTQGHAGMAEVFKWANADTGRYAVEIPLVLPSKYVPRGTADHLDRVLKTLSDFKFMGQWSLNKLKAKGPSPTYRVQLHTYGLGARLKGEIVDHVALIALPRDQSSLDDAYVWTERYDASVALNALARVDDIANQIDEDHRDKPGLTDIGIGMSFPPDPSDCRFCSFYAPGDRAGERGCNGK